MTKKEELLVLAKRCETEEPSRYIDQVIAAAITGRATSRLDPHLPYYTSSVSFAKSLEPEDALEICVRIYANKTAYVRITLANGRPVYCDSIEKPITEAMARCAAALRAKAALLP